ncbi:MAG: GNAT family N-acetyltransferase [Bacteroidota bacterium]
MISIRPIALSEQEALRQLAVSIYRTTFEAVNTPENMENYLAEAFSPAKIAAEFAEPNTYYIGAYDSDKLVAYLRLRKTAEVEKELGPSNIELQRLYVDPAYQGKGIANDLMQVSIDKAAELKLDWLWLGVWEKNHKAQRFYARWGFEKFSEHVFWMGDDPQTDWLMKKKIS